MALNWWTFHPKHPKIAAGKIAGSCKSWGNVQKIVRFFGGIRVLNHESSPIKVENQPTPEKDHSWRQKQTSTTDLSPFKKFTLWMYCYTITCCCLGEEHIQVIKSSHRTSWMICVCVFEATIEFALHGANFGTNVWYIWDLCFNKKQKSFLSTRTTIIFLNQIYSRSTRIIKFFWTFALLKPVESQAQDDHSFASSWIPPKSVWQRECASCIPSFPTKGCTWRIIPGLVSGSDHPHLQAMKLGHVGSGPTTMVSNHWQVLGWFSK